MDTITLLGSFAVVGVVISLVIEYTKGIFTKATPLQRTIYMLALSLIGGLIIFFWHFVPTNFIETFVAVVGAVNTAYLFFTKYLPNWTPPPIAVSSSQ